MSPYLFVVGFADVNGDAGHFINYLGAILYNCVANYPASYPFFSFKPNAFLLVEIGLIQDCLFLMSIVVGFGILKAWR